MRKSSNLADNVKIIEMKSFIIPIASAVILLSSCSVYRSGQTPDDVYYSPAREQKQAIAYVPADGGRDDGRRYNDRSYNGYDDYATADDRWLMMRVRNRARWSVFDDYNYYSPYSSWGWGGFYPGLNLGIGGLGYGMGFGGYYNPYGFSYYNHFNNYWNWNSYYNPYAPNIIVVNPKTNPAGYTTIRNFNLNSYNNTNYNNRRGVTGRTNYDYRPRYNNSNNNYRTLDNSRRVFSNSRTNESRSRDTYRAPSYEDRPVRTYSPSNNNSGYTPRSSSGGNNGSSGNSGSRPSRR